MILEGKKILIFSPQPWNHINVSKHHYALELSKKNDVYFFSAANGFGFSENSININEHLKVVEYQVPFPQLLRFKFDRFYTSITAYFINRIVKQKIGTTDLCIDFGCDRFLKHLGFLQSKKKIYFRVDDSPDFKPTSRGADMNLSVSLNIVEKYAQKGMKCHFINHGLSEVFIPIDLESATIHECKKDIHVGYSGNILIPHIDREILIRTIVENRKVTFHFFGVIKDSKMSDLQRQWIASLKSQPNVKLHGVLSTDELVVEFKQIDIFLLCYKSQNNSYYSDNSHKILEYLSTGKVIVSTWIRFYAGLDLFPMCNENENRDFPFLFNRILNDLAGYNNKVMAEKRIRYALENTYEKNIQKITDLLMANSK